MAASILQTTDRTKHQVYSLVMLFQAFKAAAFSWYLLCPKSPPQQVKCSIDFKSGAWLGQSESFQFSLLMKALVANQCVWGHRLVALSSKIRGISLYTARQNVLCKLLNPSCCFHHLFCRQGGRVSCFQRQWYMSRSWHDLLHDALGALDRGHLTSFSTMTVAVAFSTALRILLSSAAVVFRRQPVLCSL